MSQEQTPTYQYPGHLERYDTSSPMQRDGEIGFIMDTLDEILYAGGGTVIQPELTIASAKFFESHFSYQFYRGETSFLGLAWPLESITLSVDHALYLGNTALKQSYKIELDSTIHNQRLGPNRVTTMYDFEEVAGGDEIYFGTMLRPGILEGADFCHECDGYCYDTVQEPVTVYDCDMLYGVLDQVVLSINRDKQDRALADQAQQQY